MTIYYIILVVVSFLNKVNSYLKVRMKENKIEILYIISIFVLLFFAVNRSQTIGKDTYHYKIYFENALYTNMFELPYEPAFNFLTKLFQKFSINFESYLSFLSIVTLVPLISILKKESSKYVWLTMYIFISTQYVSSFSILRGYISLALILSAYHLLEKEEKKKTYWVCIVLSILFHYSSIIYLLIFHLGSRRYKVTYYLFAIFAAIILYMPMVAVWVRSVVINILRLIRPQYSYFTLEYSANSSLVFIIIYTLIVLLSVIYSKKLLKNKKNILLVNMAFFMLIFNLAMSWFPAYSRISSGFLIFMSLLIPEIIISEKSPEMRLLMKIGFCVVFVLYMRLNLSPVYSIYEFR